MNVQVKSPAVKAELIDPCHCSEWDRLIQLHPEASFFHCSAWARVLHKTYGHEPTYLRLVRDGQLLALVPVMEVRSPFTGHRGVCLPFTDVCEPLLFTEDAFDIVCDQLRNLGRERHWKHFEIRGGKSQIGIQSSVGFYAHTLDLRGGLDRVVSGFDSGVHRAIRKAGRSDLTVEISKTREAVVQFYRLHTQTRRRHGAPPQPLAFFLNIYHEIIEPGFGFVVLSKYGEQPAAAAVFFQFGGKAIYKFGASDESLQDRRGNNLVMSEGIRYLAESRVETLHFGRTSLFNKGLRRFKLSWGTREEPIEYCKFNSRADSWMSDRDSAAGFHTAVFARLPLVLNQLVGSLVYPHLD